MIDEKQKNLLIKNEWKPLLSQDTWGKYTSDGYYIQLNTEEEILEEVETLQVQEMYDLQNVEYVKRKTKTKMDKLVSNCLISTCDNSFNLNLKVDLNLDEMQDLINLTGIYNAEKYIGWAILEKLKELNDNKSSKLP